MNYNGTLTWVDAKATAQKIRDFIAPTFPDAYVKEWEDRYFTMHYDVHVSKVLGSDSIYIHVVKKDGKNRYVFGVNMTDQINEQAVMDLLIEKCFVYKERKPPTPVNGLSKLLGDNAQPMPVIDKD